MAKTAKKAKKAIQKSRPGRMKAYASFAEWKRDQSPKHRKLITALSKLVKATAPDFTPTVKWGQGCWVFEDSPKVYIHAEPDHLHFGFFAGSKLQDPEQLLVGKGKHVRHVKVFTAKDISPTGFMKLIEQVL